MMGRLGENNPFAEIYRLQYKLWEMEGSVGYSPYSFIKPEHAKTFDVYLYPEKEKK